MTTPLVLLFEDLFHSRSLSIPVITAFILSLCSTREYRADHALLSRHVMEQ